MMPFCCARTGFRGSGRSPAPGPRLLAARTSSARRHPQSSIHVRRPQASNHGRLELVLRPPSPSFNSSRRRAESAGDQGISSADGPNSASTRGARAPPPGVASIHGLARTAARPQVASIHGVASSRVRPAAWSHPVAPPSRVASASQPRAQRAGDYERETEEGGNDTDGTHLSEEN